MLESIALLGVALVIAIIVLPFRIIGMANNTKEMNAKLKRLVELEEKNQRNP